MMDAGAAVRMLARRAISRLACSVSEKVGHGCRGFPRAKSLAVRPRCSGFRSDRLLTRELVTCAWQDGQEADYAGKSILQFPCQCLAFLTSCLLMCVGSSK